nr:retrovirus-related Pol polyprotein from transposon TNT 1-94 [Tanacetum cinerariifolium]
MADDNQMERTLLSWMFSCSISIPLDQVKYGGNWVKLSDLKQALHGSILGNLKTLAKGFYPPSLNFLSFSWRMESQFEMSNLGELTYYLGVKVLQENDCVKIKQERYETKSLKEAVTYARQHLSFNPDDPMSPGIEDDDYDSERDILIFKELLDNYSLSLPKNESFRFDIPSSSRPPAKPPDGNT